ncbi:MAG: cysteine desulfurase [Thermoguttaceae bacterium]|nr:cysteine desulfurase [Thermoguttaceae bacterium]
MTRTDLNQLNPAAGGLPSEAQMLAWAAELSGEIPAAGVPVPSVPTASVPAASVPAATAGTDWARIAAEVLESEGASPSAGAYSPTLVSAKEAGASQAVSTGEKTVRRSSASIGGIPVEKLREDFPILSERLASGRPLVWFDNGATTQRPKQVIDRISYYYTHENSNVHRAAHELAARSTDAYENARSTVAKFLGAGNANDIVFVRGTTEGINLVAQSYVRPLLRPGDEIIVSLLEHHANIVPWQLIAAATGAKIRVIPVDESGQLDLAEYTRLFNRHTRFVTVAHVSNVLGTVTPVAELVAIAHAHGVRILIDGAQSVAHIPVNVTALDPDFYVFSGHKIFGPNGIGAVYGKTDALEEAQPWQGGGNMIADVTFERTVYQAAPNKFEAGTGSIADAVGLGAALEYMMQIGMVNVAAYEHELTQYGMARLGAIPGLHLIGTAPGKSGVLSFVLDNHDIVSVGKYLDSQGIAVRAGHHCAQPILRHYGLEGSVRPVLAFYNTPEEIDLLADALLRLVH